MQPDSSPSSLLVFPDITISLSWPREQFLIHGCFFLLKPQPRKQNLISKLCPLLSTLKKYITPFFPSMHIGRMVSYQGDYMCFLKTADFSVFKGLRFLG